MMMSARWRLSTRRNMYPLVAGKYPRHCGLHCHDYHLDLVNASMGMCGIADLGLLAQYWLGE